MDQRIRELLAQISALEDELAQTLHEKEQRLFYQFNGRRIEFEDSIRATHARMKRGILRWIVTDRPQNFVTGPFIYSLILPLLMLDLFLSVFQAVCFPIYRITKVKRGDYIVVDRLHLGYLNLFERFHCAYCGYANGLLAYAVEIAARTEQYFCPIKHARKLLGSHARAQRFLEYGDATDYHARLEAFRAALEKAEPSA
ncbi:MAG: hypothetical protein IT492_00030 [Gammaproteobacteria bacterium]|nr:hypothetical protein [Gammaproteobacteria bacterium]